MFTVSAFNEDPTISALNNVEQSDAQKDANEYIKQKIRILLGQNDDEEANDSGILANIAQRRNKKLFWKNLQIYLQTGFILAAHIGALYAARFLSYKFISNKEIMNFKRR